MEQQHEHIVRSYEEELTHLNNKIARMGGLVEKVLGQSFDALERRDPELAVATINEDEEIDALERQIEELIHELRDEDGHRVGRLVEYAPTETIFTNPADERTKEYVTGKFG